MGEPCPPKSPGAVCFCALGALAATIPDVKSGAMWISRDFRIAARHLNLAIPPEVRGVSVATYNDTLASDKSDVLALFDVAIEHASERSVEED